MESKTEFNGLGGLRTHLRIVSAFPTATSKLRSQLRPPSWGRFPKVFTMSKFAIGEKVDHAADDQAGGTVIAVFPTVDGNFRDAVDMEGYGALQFFNEEKLVVHLC
jgi:hypothetical protein